MAFSSHPPFSFRFFNLARQVQLQPQVSIPVSDYPIPPYLDIQRPLHLQQVVRRLRRFQYLRTQVPRPLSRLLLILLILFTQPLPSSLRTLLARRRRAMPRPIFLPPPPPRVFELRTSRKLSSTWRTVVCNTQVRKQHQW